jgi:isochorismate pyruvate lyase
VKTAADCENISEIRAGIDRLDHEVISLLGQRFEFVEAASKFKTGELHLNEFG